MIVKRRRYYVIASQQPMDRSFANREAARDQISLFPAIYSFDLELTEEALEHLSTDPYTSRKGKESQYREALIPFERPEKDPSWLSAKMRAAHGTHFTCYDAHFTLKSAIDAYLGSVLRKVSYDFSAQSPCLIVEGRVGFRVEADLQTLAEVMEEAPGLGGEEMLFELWSRGVDSKIVDASLMFTPHRCMAREASSLVRDILRRGGLPFCSGSCVRPGMTYWLNRGFTSSMVASRAETERTSLSHKSDNEKEMDSRAEALEESGKLEERSPFLEAWFSPEGMPPRDSPEFLRLKIVYYELGRAMKILEEEGVARSYREEKGVINWQGLIKAAAYVRPYEVRRSGTGFALEPLEAPIVTKPVWPPWWGPFQEDAIPAMVEHMGVARAIEALPKALLPAVPEEAAAEYDAAQEKLWAEAKARQALKAEQGGGEP